MHSNKVVYHHTYIHPIMQFQPSCKVEGHVLQCCFYETLSRLGWHSLHLLDNGGEILGQFIAHTDIKLPRHAPPSQERFCTWLRKRAHPLWIFEQQSQLSWTHLLTHNGSFITTRGQRRNETAWQWHTPTPVESTAGKTTWNLSFTLSCLL